MATFYIAPDGDDDNDGSEASPWVTLAHALDESASGDTIQLATGTYLNQTEITGSSRQRVGTRYILGGSGDPRDTVLDFNRNALVFTGVTGSSTDIFELRGVTIQNVFNNRSTIFITQMEGKTNLFDLIFKNVSGPSTTNINGGTGLISGCSDLDIRSCVFWDCYGASDTPIVALFGFQSGSRKAVMRSSVIYQSGSTPPTGSQPLNLFVSTKGTISGNFEVRNSIVYTPSSPLDFGTFTDPFTVTFNNSCVDTIATPRDAPVYVNSITTDPLFVDATNGDFRLRPASPCIGTGSLT